MTEIYISVNDIVEDDAEPRTEGEIIEFSADTWMLALDYAYDWLKSNRVPTKTYHVYA